MRNDDGVNEKDSFSDENVTSISFPGMENRLDQQVKEEAKTFSPLTIVKYAGVQHTLLWGMLFALLTAGSVLMSSSIADGFVPAFAVLGFGIGAVAWIDLKTHLIKNAHSLNLAWVIGLLTVLGAWLSSDWSSLIWGVVAAAIVMVTFILLVVFVNFGSGGDIKFSPIPALLLGAASSVLTALIWLFMSFIFAMVFLIIGQKMENRNFIAFGPAMAFSLPLTILLSDLLYQSVGLPPF